MSEKKFLRQKPEQIEIHQKLGIMLSTSPAPSSSFDFEPSHWNPLVIALVGFICCIFLLFSYHRIFQRHCVGGGGGRHLLPRRRLNENNPDSPSLQFQSRGLDSFLVQSLPISQFKKRKEKEKEEVLRHGNGTTDLDRNDDCAVCLGEFEDSDWLKQLPNCSHVFHVCCIDTWFQSHSNCPLCRSSVYNMNQNTVSIYALLEALRREENDQERSEQFRVLQNQILQGFQNQAAIDTDHSTTTTTTTTTSRL